MSDERFARGRARLDDLDADGGRRLLDALADVAPDLGRYAVEFAFGDIYSRPGLDLQRRQLVTIAALTTLGGAEPQLELHLRAARNLGLTTEEIVEAILQCVPYAGFPRAINAVLVAGRVLSG